MENYKWSNTIKTIFGKNISNDKLNMLVEYCKIHEKNEQKGNVAGYVPNIKQHVSTLPISLDLLYDVGDFEITNDPSKVDTFVLKYELGELGLSFNDIVDNVNILRVLKDAIKKDVIAGLKNKKILVYLMIDNVNILNEIELNAILTVRMKYKVIDEIKFEDEKNIHIQKQNPEFEKEINKQSKEIINKYGPEFAHALGQKLIKIAVEDYLLAMKQYQNDIPEIYWKNISAKVKETGIIFKPMMIDVDNDCAWRQIEQASDNGEWYDFDEIEFFTDKI